MKHLTDGMTRAPSMNSRTVCVGVPGVYRVLKSVSEPTSLNEASPS